MEEGGDCSRGCLAWVLILVGFGFLAWGAYLRSLAHDAISWPEVEAYLRAAEPRKVTTRVDVENRNRDTHGFEVSVTLAYKVEGKTYKHLRASTFSSRAAAESFARSVNGTREPIRYNPKDPEQIHTSPGRTNSADIQTNFVYASGFIVLGLLLLTLFRTRNGSLVFAWQKSEK